jgi:hypothetical protein
VRAVIQLDPGANPDSCRVAQDEIKVFLGDEPAIAHAPDRRRALDDVGQANLDTDDISPLHGMAEGRVELELRCTQKGPAGTVRQGAGEWFPKLVPQAQEPEDAKRKTGERSQESDDENYAG